MARKSASDKAVAPVVSLPLRLPDPPKNLSVAQSEIWKLVIASRSGDMIAPEAYPVLVEYCRSITAADMIAEQIDHFDPLWIAEDDGLKRWDKLLGMQDRVSAKVASLATKLRITPQTRIHKEKAGTIASKGGGQRKPWQYEA